MVLNFIATAKKASSSSSKTTELKELESTMLVRKMDIFAGKLGMQDDLASILNSQHLGQLDDYITDLTRRFPENDVSFLRILTSKYDDEKVAKAFVKAQTTGHSRELAKNLQQEQFAAWLREGKSIDNVFQLLKLKGLKESVVNSRGLDSLKGYIAFLNNGRQNDDMFMEVMSKGFGGEFKLAAVFTNAKAAGDQLGVGTEAKAEALQTMVFQYWFRGGVNSKRSLYRKANLEEATAEFYQKRVVNQFGDFLANRNPTHNGVSFTTPRR
ncbi:hypothetical protein PHMEG_0007297 [Phytophthora megakarya]|uniref:RxLR effector protein n=1 Tax=Phytophthora megakarya TaxID=4795 RepID=A0A225WLZ0_9STRA|nr:hypothetical protein PHMEG_0007297 [Phytophthora megakarya]